MESPMNRRPLRCLAPAVVAAACVLAPAAASADVLVNAIEPSTIACGGAIKTGVWYQSFSGGPRWAKIRIQDASGRSLWSRNVTATTSWRYFRYVPACGRRYTVVYQTAGGTQRFGVRVR
jgi:hypothetical protein